MRLTDLKKHLEDNGCEHYERDRNFDHDVYINKETRRKCTIPLGQNDDKNEDVEYAFCQLACLELDIPGFYNETRKELLDHIFNNKEIKQKQ